MLVDLRTEGLNIYFLCPFLCCFFLIGASIFSEQSIFGKYSIFKIILDSISQILVIIPYLIFKKIQNKNIKKSQIEFTYNKIEEDNDNIKIWQTILLGFVNFCNYFLFYLGQDLYENKFKLIFLSSNVLFLVVLQKFILDIQIYRHQTAAFIIFFVLDVIYIIIIILDEKLNYDIKQLIFIILSTFFLTFEITYEKKLLIGSSLLVYKLCILVGIFSFGFKLISSIITTIIESYTDFNDRNKIYLFNYKNYFEDIADNITLEIILILVYLVLSCISNILQFLIIKHLSANHLLITYVMFAIFNSISMKMQDIEITQLTLIFSFVLYVLLFFASFIFLEIIQLNFCGINKDITFKRGLRSDVNRYMQSFSSTDDDEENNNNSIIECEAKSTEMNEKNISSTSSDIDSYIDE